MKTNSGKKGAGMPVVRNPQFFFREGICWSDINTTYLKCRKKSKSIHDVKSMSIFAVSSKVPEDYIITLINTSFISHYVDDYVNNTQTFQINDARQLPVVIPDEEEIQQAQAIVEMAIKIKTGCQIDTRLEELQMKAERLIIGIYHL